MGERLSQAKKALSSMWRRQGKEEEKGPDLNTRKAKKGLIA